MMNVPDIWSAQNAARQITNAAQCGNLLEDSEATALVAEMAVGLGLPQYMVAQMAPLSLMLFVVAKLVENAE